MGAAWTLCQVVNSCVCPGREATGTGVTLSSAGSPASQDPTGKSQVTSFARALVISKTGDFSRSQIGILTECRETVGTRRCLSIAWHRTGHATSWTA